MINVISAVFRGAQSTTTRNAYQYDYGQVLKTNLALPETYEVQFSNNSSGGVAITQIGNADGVTIPDQMFISGAPIYAWIFLHQGADDGETVYFITIPVTKRAKPTSKQPTPVQKDAITQAIAALNAAVEQTGHDVTDAAASASAALASERAAQAAQQAIENMAVSSTTLSAGSDATVTKTEHGGVVNLSFGIPQGDKGDAAGFGTVSATVDANTGTPSVEVTTSGPDTAKNIGFAFHNLKGDTGATPNFTIGTVQTLLPTQDATATITGMAEAPVLNLGIPKGYSGDATNLAADYSSNKTYTVGEYCIYNGSLYRCNTAITTAEAWTAAHWTAAVLGDDVGELKNAINKLDNEIFDYISAVNTDAWTYNNNNAVTSNGDGTYNIGTSDYGTTAWGGNALIYPGTYKLFGSPYGLVFVSPNTAYASAIVSNDTGAEKIVTISEAGMYYVGVRTGAKPPTSYVLTPYLIKVDSKLDEVDAEIDAVSSWVNKQYANNVQRNLIGRNIGTHYPVSFAKGDTITISTADGSNIPSGTGIYLYNASDQLIDYFTCGTTPTYSKVLNYNVAYIMQSKTVGVPLQVELGDVATIYQSYPEEHPYLAELAGNGMFAITANDIVVGTFDQSGYIYNTNRSHSKDIFIKAYKGDRVVASSSTHNLIIAVVKDPLGLDVSGNTLETMSWASSVDRVIQHDGYYVILAQVNPSDFNATVTIYSNWSNVIHSAPAAWYNEEIATTVESVQAVNTEPALLFPLVTDIHRYSTVRQTFDNFLQNIKAVSKEIKFDFAINMGDLFEGNQAQETALASAHDLSEQMMGIGLPYLFAEGNHDGNPYINSAADTFNLSQVYSAYYAYSRPTAWNVNENGTDYYVDFDAFNVRLISLNACNTSVSTTYAFGENTATWLASALDTDKTVILFEHLSSISTQVWNNNSPTNATDITDALTAFVNGGGNLIQISGHSHIDLAFVEPWLSIMQVCQKFEKADITTPAYGAITGYIDVMGNPTRTAGTYTEDAWSVCVYKPNSNILHMIRFGAGIDRHFHVTPITPSTVTSMLSGMVTWSSSDTDVATVSDGVITGVATGRCAVLAKDTSGNYECWIVDVA